MSYFTPGGSNLMTSPYAPRMGETQRRELLSHISPDREVPGWIKAQSTNAEAEAEEQILLEEWEAQQEDIEEYPILLQYLAQRRFETDKERAEAEVGFIAEYHTWVQEMVEQGHVDQHWEFVLAARGLLRA